MSQCWWKGFQCTVERLDGSSEEGLAESSAETLRSGTVHIFLYEDRALKNLAVLLR